uniref:Meiosis-specific nuclear structural protein 1 n=1 Tax=Diabrotica virgifera virgifera TaxID=50390 RepID=A0A6P7GG54_DIAVI
MGDDIRLCLMDNVNVIGPQNRVQEGYLPLEENQNKQTPVQYYKIEPKLETVEKKDESGPNLEDHKSSTLRHIEQKNAYRNFDRFMNLHRKEQEEQLQAQSAMQENAFREKKAYQENVLARELDVIKRKEFTEAKMRQLLRENSSELRELERKLKAAYINKELAAQISQKQAERINEKIRETEAHKVMRQAWIDQKEYQKQLLQDDMIKKSQYKQELQEQLIMREKMKRHLYEEYLREKKLIDDIVQRIHDEDEREAYEKFCRMKKTRSEMMAFKHAQDVWKKKRMEEIEEENRKIEEYLTTKTAVVQARYGTIYDPLVAKLAEDSRLEQLSLQKRRMKMLQLRKDVEEMLRERRQKQAEEFQMLIEVERDSQRKAEARRRVIEEERIRMLQEHVKNLVGYLPKGLLKVEDLPYLSTDVVDHVFRGDPSSSNTTMTRPNY